MAAVPAHLQSRPLLCYPGCKSRSCSLCTGSFRKVAVLACGALQGTVKGLYFLNLPVS